MEHRILVCGVGAVGERHINNLLGLGYYNIAVCRTRRLAYRTLNSNFPVFFDLERALKDFEPTVVFVTNPTALHLSVALRAADAECHLFIEKPISHNLQSLEQLQATLDQRKRFAMVGYMLRFHPLFRQLKQWLDEGPDGTLGHPLFARTSWGEHIPDWHPWEDYRNSYAVKREMGGGPALTLSHEFDLLVWMFGHASEILGMSTANTPLVANCEHALDALIRFERGVVANVHLDYCQRPPQRLWELVGSNGRIVFNYLSSELSLWRSQVGEVPRNGVVNTPKPAVWDLSATFSRNDLFIAELRYFFDCLERNEQPSPGVLEAAESVRIAMACLGERDHG